nr:uncharacterized protein LOC109167327 [Ipomoea trifida]
MMRFVCHDYKTRHNVDAVEFFANAQLKEKTGEICSIVNRTEVVIVLRDIRELFDFLVWEGEHPDSSGHAYNHNDLWREVRGEEAHEELKFSFKKKNLKQEFKRAVDILSKIIENRVARIDDATEQKFTILSVLLINYLVDWSMPSSGSE